MRQNPPAIAQLNSDVWWHVFSMNTFCDEDFFRTHRGGSLQEQYLITARYTSQVCTLWRNIMLSSLTIWANTLDIWHLGNRRWREEVLDRTGCSPLSIIYRGSLGIEILNRDLLSLDDHWDRIRRLSIYFYPGFLEAKKYSRSIKRSTPPLALMEIFNIILTDDRDFMTAGPDVTEKNIISNITSPLRIFMTEGALVSISSFSSTLRQLRLENCSLPAECMIAITKMHSLETLVIIKPFSGGTSTWSYNSEKTLTPYNQSPVLLPRLRWLSLNMDIEACAWLLGQLEPSSETVTQATAFYQEAKLQTSFSEPSYWVPKHAGNMLKGHSYSAFKLNYRSIKLQNGSVDGSQAGESFFLFDASSVFMQEETWSSVVVSITEAVLQMDITSVVTLSLHLLPMNRFGLSSEAEPYLGRLFTETFSAVQIIEGVNPQTLSILYDIQVRAGSHKLILPSLRRISFCRITTRSMSSRPLFQFVRQRREQTTFKCIKGVDVQQYREVSSEGSYLFLEGIDDLDQFNEILNEYEL